MSLEEHGQAEQSAGYHRHAEVEEAAAHGAVEMEGALLSLHFEVREEAHRAKRDQKKQQCSKNCHFCAPRRIDGNIAATCWQPADSVMITPKEPCSC